jgi:NIPSNAP protein
MSQVSKRTSFLGLALLLAALAFATRRMSAAGDARPAAAAPTAKGQFFELRVYTAAPGKMDALNKRFRDHTLKFFEKHGIKSVGYWTAVDEKHQGRLYYVVAYPDRESRERMLVNGIAKDPDFLKMVAESEKDGKLTDGIDSVLMTPTDYSPLK